MPVQGRGTGRAWAEEGVGVEEEQQRGRGRDSQGHCAASSFQRCVPALPEPWDFQAGGPGLASPPAGENTESVLCCSCWRSVKRGTERMGGLHQNVSSVRVETAQLALHSTPGARRDPGSQECSANVCRMNE